MVCALVRRDNLRALARGLSTVKAQRPRSTSLVYHDMDLAHYGVSRAKDWVFAVCGTTMQYVS